MIGVDDFGNLALVFGHLLEAGALHRLGSDRELIGILAWNKSLRNNDEEACGTGQYHKEAHQRRKSMAQHPLEAAIVRTEHSVKEPLSDSVEPPVLGRV